MKLRNPLAGALEGFAQRRGISARALILSIVLFAIAITLAPPTQHYFAQRAQISSLEANVEANRKKLLEARAELERWRDPDYVRSQARQRLHFVLPGERQYLILGVTPSVSSGTTSAAAINEEFPIGAPWYSRIVSSITSVGVGDSKP